MQVHTTFLVCTTLQHGCEFVRAACTRGHSRRKENCRCLFLDIFCKISWLPENPSRSAVGEGLRGARAAPMITPCFQSAESLRHSAPTSAGRCGLNAPSCCWVTAWTVISWPWLTTVEKKHFAVFDTDHLCVRSDILTQGSEEVVGLVLVLDAEGSIKSL